MKKNQSGFSIALLLVGVAVIVVAGFVIYNFVNMNKDDGDNDAATDTSKVEETGDAVIKHLGINLDDYDASTGMAGDMKFAKYHFEPGSVDSIFLEYGRLELNNDVEGNSERHNPQPTFLAPLGTKIHALIDGEVIAVPKLYSDDYSVHMQPEGSELIFETEHVINVAVKVGDKVKAGDVIAEISDYNGDKLEGLGLFEIGVLIPGNPPKHGCTFDYLHPSYKEEALTKISALMDQWEEFTGNDKLYDQESMPIVGCANRDLVEG